MNGGQNLLRVLMRVRITFGIAHLHVSQWPLTWKQDIGSGQGYTHFLPGNSEVTTDIFPSFFRKYNSVFTYSALFQTYVFSAVIEALIAFKVH